MPQNETPSAEKPVVTTDKQEINMRSLQYGDEIEKLVATAGTLALSDTEKAILNAPIKDSDVLIKPDGVIYLPWTKYSQRLTAAFGGTGWAMVPEGTPKYGTSLVVWGFHLIIKGVYCATAYGEQTYSKEFSKMSYGEACEGAKSNALMRLCKAIGLGLELWDKDFIDRWINWYAEFEWENKGGQNKKKWKLKKDAFITVPPALLLAVEFGYKQCEKGNNLEKALSEFKSTYIPPPSSSLSETRREAAPAPSAPAAAPAKVTPPPPEGPKSKASSSRKKPGQEVIPMEEIKDDAINSKAAEVEKTPRVLEAIKQLNACSKQKDLTLLFADIKKRYEPEGFTKVEIEDLRIAANQKFVKLGAGR